MDNICVYLVMLWLLVAKLESKPNCSEDDVTCHIWSEDIHGEGEMEEELEDSEDYKASCMVYGSFSIVHDTQIPDDGSEEDRAELTLPAGLEFKRSQLKNSPLGVWTTQPFPSRTRFGPAQGDEVLDNGEGTSPSSRSWGIFENGELLFWVDPSNRTTSNWMQYVNAARTMSEQNLVSWQDGDQMYYYTFRDIRPGEELLSWFGHTHAQSYGIRRSGWCDNIMVDETCWPFFYKCPEGSCAVNTCNVDQSEEVDLDTLDQQAVGYERENMYDEYDCPFFEPFNILRDMKVVMDGSVPDRAFLTLPPGLVIKESSIKGAGLGVFATEDLPSRTRFAPSEGFMMYDVEADRDNSWSWLISEQQNVSTRLCDAKDPSRSNWARFVNTANYIKDQNLGVLQLRGLRHYYTLRRIPAGSELISWYGHSYDDYLGIKTRPPFSWNDAHVEACWPFFFTCPEGSCLKDTCDTDTPATPG